MRFYGCKLVRERRNWRRAKIKNEVQKQVDAPERRLTYIFLLILPGYTSCAQVLRMVT